MILASMINLDEDALICDLAETYHIFDYRSLPLKLVATLSAGLRNDSRIKLNASGYPASQDTILLATIADRVELFRYGFTEDASKKRNYPTSLVDALCGNITNASGVKSFKTSEEFEAMLSKIRGD